jgi:hypothetical protein
VLQSRQLKVSPMELLSLPVCCGALGVRLGMLLRGLLVRLLMVRNALGVLRKEKPSVLVDLFPVPREE